MTRANEVQKEIDRLCKIQNEQRDEFTNFSHFYTAEFMASQGKKVNDKIEELQQKHKPLLSEYF